MAHSLIDELIFPSKSLAGDMRLALDHEAVRIAFATDRLARLTLGETADYLVRQYYELLQREDAQEGPHIDAMVTYLVTKATIQNATPLPGGEVCWAYILPDFWTVLDICAADPSEQHRSLCRELLGLVYNLPLPAMIKPLKGKEEKRYEKYAGLLERVIENQNNPSL